MKSSKLLFNRFSLNTYFHQPAIFSVSINKFVRTFRKIFFYQHVPVFNKSRIANKIGTFFKRKLMNFFLAASLRLRPHLSQCADRIHHAQHQIHRFVQARAPAPLVHLPLAAASFLQGPGTSDHRIK